MDCIRSLIIPKNTEIYNPQINDDLDDYHFLENASKHRKRTNFKYLIFYLISVCLSICSLVYCILTGDIKRVIVGFDRCGNVCGEINTFKYGFRTNCRSENMQHKPYFNIYNQSCVEKCEADTFAIGYKCMPTVPLNIPFIDVMFYDLYSCLPEIIESSFIAFGLSCAMLFFLRVVPRVFTWISLMGTGFVWTAATILCWFLVGYDGRMYIMGTFFTIALLVMVIVTFSSLKDITLVIQLFKEADKAAAAIPFILFEPILTFIALGLVIVINIYCNLWISSAGEFTQSLDYDGLYNEVELSSDIVIEISYGLNFFVSFWTIQIIYGCENMILAGATSTWYFARNKTGLKGVIWRSAKNMLKYHLGTISLGGLIITVVHTILTIFSWIGKMAHNKSCHYCCEKSDHFLGGVKSMLITLSRNAYIITSMYGLKLSEAGAKALSLLFENSLSDLSLIFGGSTILTFAKVVIIFVSGVLGYLLIEGKEHVQNWMIPVLVIVIFSYGISHTFMTVYEMILNTLFLCFGEDTKMNDGESQTYYMPSSLMEFVKNAENMKKPKTNTNTNVNDDTDSTDV